MYARVMGSILCAVVLGAGCKGERFDSTESGPYQLEIEQAEIRTASPLSSTEVRGALDAALRASPMFDPPGGDDGPRLSANVRVLELRGPAGQPVLRFELEVDPPRGLVAALGRDFEAIIEIEHNDGALELDQDLPLATGRAVAVLEAKLSLARGDTLAIERLLDSDDPELILLTLDWIELHRHRALADRVASLLPHRSEAVVLRAVECLGRIGSPEHVPGMIEAVRLADRAHANRLYDAVALVGGPQAEGFLEFAARNEDDPALVEAAQRAWMRVRGGALSDGPDEPPPKRGHR